MAKTNDNAFMISNQIFMRRENTSNFSRGFDFDAFLCIKNVSNMYICDAATNIRKKFLCVTKRKKKLNEVNEYSYFTELN